MKATLRYVEGKFGEFNARMFGGVLPPIPVRLSDASRFLGMFVCRRQPGRLGRPATETCELRINTRMDLPEEVVEDTIIHEMIHYYIHHRGLRDSSPHGPVFRKIMADINATHGRNVTVSFRHTPETARQAVDSRHRWHVIARVELKDGRTGVKVLPRVAPKIIAFHDAMKRVPEVAGVTLYLHHDPYFNRYPTSTAQRLHIVAEAELRPHLREARLVIIENGRLKDLRQQADNQ